MRLAVAFDTSQSIRNSIRDVEFTLLLTVCIVVMVIFLFLRNISATLIPGAAVPFSIVGTFAVMYLLGYSLNYLSLMALTLSVGFVVDDAIVMLENIVRHMEMGETRMHAAVNAAREIGFTIVSMTLSLVAVFIPVLFLGGIVGRLLHEFSVTIVVAILISGFVSLSLTPMLGSRFLKSEHETRHGLLYRALGGGFDLLLRWYEFTLRIALRFSLGYAGGGDSDAGGDGISLLQHADRLHSQPGQRLHVRHDPGPAGHLVRIHGEAPARHRRGGARGPQRSDRGSVRDGRQPGVFLRGYEAPFPATLSVDQIIEELRPKVMAVPALFTFMQNPPPITVSGQNSASVYQLTLQSANLNEIYTWAPQTGGQDAPASRVSWTSTPTCRSPPRR